MTKRIVICGMSRSGTSLFYTLLSNNLAGVEVLDTEISALAMGSEREIYLTKRPLDCFNLQAIFDKFSGDDVRVIFSIRDPRDLICSVHQLVPHDYFIGYQNQYFIDVEKNYSSLTNPGLRSIVVEWLQYKNDSRVFTLRYEDLILRTKEAMAELSRFLDEDIDIDGFDITSKTKIPKGIVPAMNGARKIDGNSIGSWKKHPCRVWDEFTGHREMHDIMNVLGYETTADWFLEHFKGRLPATELGGPNP